MIKEFSSLKIRLGRMINTKNTVTNKKSECQLQKMSKKLNLLCSLSIIVKT